MIKQLLKLFVLSALLWVGMSVTAQAATMPNPGDFALNDGQPREMRVLVGDSGTITVLNSYIKVYSKSAAPQITLQNISGCASNSSTIRAYSTNSGQTSTGAIGSTTLSPSNCPGSFTWTLSSSSLANIGTEQYYVWILQAASTSGLTYFNLTSTNANFGYIGRLAPGGLGDDRFAIQNSYSCSDVGSYSPWANCITYKARSSTNYTIKFATHCANTSNVSQPLRWYDDDQNNPETNPSDAQVSAVDMRFDIYDETDGSYVVQNYRPSEGNDQEGQYSMVFKPTHKYRWVWKNVADSNALQFQLPYDSFFYNVTCDDAPKAVLDLSCDTLKFRVSDSNDDKYDVRLRWDGTDTSSVLQDLSPGNSPGQNVYQFDISNRKDFGTHTVSLRIRSETGTVVEDNPTATIGPCATATCSSTILSPTSPSPGEPVTLTQSIHTDIGTQGDGTLYNAQVVLTGGPTITYQSAGPGTVAAANPVTVVGPNSGTNTVGPKSGGGVGPGSANGVNDESVTWTVTYSGAGNYGGWVAFTGGFSINCPINGDGTFNVSQKPYTRVWGGDVSVGCQSSDVWKTGTDVGKILTFNSGSGKGSGTSLAAQALGRIAGFSSSQMNSNTDDYLTFANAGAGVDATWGGSFGANQCAKDQFAGAPSSTTSFKAALPTTTTTQHYANGGNLNSGTIGSGQRVIIYADNDVAITGSGILYDTSGWTDLTKIPSFTLIVKGDIKISRTVSELSGTYIAQPRSDGTGGTIYTCTNGSTLYTAANLYAGCNNRTLIVYGSFIAKNVKFLRLSGSTNTAANTDTAGTGTAAEKFVYGPEMWMKASGTGSNVGTYDAITSMPPVF